MTTAVPAPSAPGWGRRFQGLLVIGSLLAAVVVTVALVATPASSGPAPPGMGRGSSATRLPAGVRVEVRGGDPFVAYGLADRLTGAGASLGAVRPAPDSADVEPSTMIVYYDRRQLAAATSIRSMLGGGTLRRQQVFEPLVDVTIVLGKDLSRL
jgi:hypothetical protein